MDGNDGNWLNQGKVEAHKIGTNNNIIIYENKIRSEKRGWLLSGDLSRDIDLFVTIKWWIAQRSSARVRSGVTWRG